MRILTIDASLLLLPCVAGAAETLPPGAPAQTKFATYDAATKKLYIAHNTEVTVVDTDALRVSARITGLNAARAVAIGPNDRGYVTSSHGANVTVFDTKTGASLATIPAGQDANAIVYNPASHRVFAMNDDDGTITVINAANNKLVKTIPLSGGEGVEAAATDGKGQLYVSHSAGREIIRVDTKRASVDRHYLLDACPDPSGLALDTADNRAFVSCLKGLLVVLDTNTGHVVTTLPIGPGGQSAIYNAQRKRIFSANADTTMSVIVVDRPDSYHALPPVATPQNARTATENFATGQIYLPVASTLMVVPADGSN